MLLALEAGAALEQQRVVDDVRTVTLYVLAMSLDNADWAVRAHAARLMRQMASRWGVSLRDFYLSNKNLLTLSGTLVGERPELPRLLAEALDVPERDLLFECLPVALISLVENEDLRTLRAFAVRLGKDLRTLIVDFSQYAVAELIEGVRNKEYSSVQAAQIKTFLEANTGMPLEGAPSHHLCDLLRPSLRRLRLSAFRGCVACMYERLLSGTLRACARKRFIALGRKFIPACEKTLAAAGD